MSSDGAPAAPSRRRARPGVRGRPGHVAHRAQVGAHLADRHHRDRRRGRPPTRDATPVSAPHHEPGVTTAAGDHRDAGTVPRDRGHDRTATGQPGSRPPRARRPPGAGPAAARSPGRRPTGCRRGSQDGRLKSPPMSAARSGPSGRQRDRPGQPLPSAPTAATRAASSDTAGAAAPAGPSPATRGTGWNSPSMKRPTRPSRTTYADGLACAARPGRRSPRVALDCSALTPRADEVLSVPAVIRSRWTSARSCWSVQTICADICSRASSSAFSAAPSRLHRRDPVRGPAPTPPRARCPGGTAVATGRAAPRSARAATGRPAWSTGRARRAAARCRAPGCRGRRQEVQARAAGRSPHVDRRRADRPSCRLRSATPRPPGVMRNVRGRSRCRPAAHAGSALRVDGADLGAVHRDLPALVGSTASGP